MKSAEEGFPESALIGWGDPIKRLLRWIDGKIPLTESFNLRIARIDGEIPPIDWRNGEMELFARLNRKISAYVLPEKRAVMPLTGKYPLILLFALRTRHLI
jgi:hypothetical protein